MISPSTTVDYGLDVEAVTPGNYPLTFAVENDFGCSADTTVFLEVIDNPGAIITAGPDQVYCSDPVTLLGGLAGPGGSACGADAGTNEICLGNGEFQSFTYCPDSPGDGTVMT